MLGDGFGRLAPLASAAARLLVVLVAAFAADSAATPIEAVAARTTSSSVSDTVRAGSVTLIYQPESQALADRVLRSFADLPQLPGMPLAAPTQVTVVLASDEADFEAQVGGAVPEWGAGVALPATGRIILPAYASGRTRGRDLDKLVRHEWAHVALGSFLEGLRIPHWFHEGYAEWASGSFDAQEGWRLRVSLALGRTPPLDSLSLDWPGDRASAEVAYLLSASAIEYLARASGPAGISRFIEEWREMGSFEPAFRATFGVTTGQFESDWTEYVKRRYGWLLVLSHSLVFWSVTGMLLVLLAWLRRRRTRERLARMRAADPPPSPDFWSQAPSLPPNTSAEVGYLRDESATRSDSEPGADPTP